MRSLIAAWTKNAPANLELAKIRRPIWGLLGIKEPDQMQSGIDNAMGDLYAGGLNVVEGIE